MIFLTKFKASGFKSFATNVSIDFLSPMSGIVGPNGSGKSNIVDAIKWVLGERSTKTLRGKTNEDVIFHGSKGHDKARYAEITLVFDNQHHLLHHEAKEVSVTRRLTRGTGNNEYFINEEPCRLKDIQEMFLDTGLSKGSLGIISQGTVQWFVEAKPEDRRTIFEDAAGIGLYTKKKEESNAQLARANDNLIRVTDIVNELGKDVRKLIKQAEKAQIYAQKHKELMHLDLTLLVKDLRYFKERLIKIDAQLNTARNELSVYEPDLKQIEQSLVFAREKAEIADQTIETLMQNLNEIIQEISTVELQKHSVQTKLQNDITSGNVEKKALAYRELITTSKFELEQLKERINKLQDEINTYSEVIEGLNTKRNTLTESNSKSAIKLAEIRMQVKAIQDEINSHSSIAIGPRTVIDYKQTLFGICGLVKDFVNVNKEYEPAILTVLGKNTQNVIVNDERDAKHAIDFLRRNKSGKATFLPISSIKSREIKPELLEALKTVTGYINIAVNLVQTDARFHHIMSFLLGNVIVCQDLESAHKASKITYQLYRVVTLDGDVVNAGGSIVGGYDRKSIVQSIDLPKRLEELNSEFQTIDQQLNTDRLALENINTELGEITAKQNEKRIMQSRYEQTSKITQEQLYKYEMDYEQLSKTHKLADKTSQWNEQALNEKIAKLTSKKDKLNEELNVARQSKAIHKAKIEDLEARLTEIRFRVDKHRDLIANEQTNKVKCENVLENARNKINQNYKMTIEYAMEHYQDELPMSDNQAREIAAKLQNEIDQLGPINMEAITELDEKQKRYDDLLKQQKELEVAQKVIIDAIKELDEKAKLDFGKTIDAVNQTLPQVFSYLLGGGSCRLEYVDPENILSSGIDVLANPPGKNVVHLNLLSGGEKTLVALSILFAILKIKNFPLIILDEAESALDPANVERFGNIIHENAKHTQFVVITHRPGTMERCEMLFGATMQTQGVTSLFKVSLTQAKEEFIESEK